MVAGSKHEGANGLRYVLAVSEWISDHCTGRRRKRMCGQADIHENDRSTAMARSLKTRNITKAARKDMYENSRNEAVLI